MNAARAEALRWIFPLLFRLATTDFFGTGDLPDDERDKCEDDRPPNCTMTVNGSRRATAADATPIRLSITNLLSGGDYRVFKKLGQVKRRAHNSEFASDFLFNGVRETAVGANQPLKLKGRKLSRFKVR